MGDFKESTGGNPFYAQEFLANFEQIRGEVRERNMLFRRVAELEKTNLNLLERINELENGIKQAIKFSEDIEAAEIIEVLRPLEIEYKK